MAFVEEQSIKNIKALLTLQSLWNFWLLHIENRLLKPKELFASYHSAKILA